MNPSTLARITLFSTLPATEIRRLAASLRCIEMAPGTVLFREGDPGHCFYLILDGEMEILKALGTSEERHLACRGNGQFVGEMSLIGTDRLRSASVRSCKQTILLEMTRADFDALLHRYPTIAYELAKVLSLSLRDANNATIRDLQEKNRQLEAAFQELRAAQAQIIAKEKLDHELELAREIQESMLPRALPSFAGYELGVKMIPARTVGGDFYDFIPLDGDHLGLAVGDVSGEGVPAALFMAMTRSLVRSEARRTRSPREVLQCVNHTLMEMNEAGMFVTVLYGVLERCSGLFEYARAGHLLPFVCTAGGTVVTPPAGLGHPLGVLEQASLDENTLLLEAGSALALYSDGVVEAVSSDDTFFGIARLHRAVIHSHEGGVEAMCRETLERMHDHCGTVTPQDDVTLVFVRRDVIPPAA